MALLYYHTHINHLTLTTIFWITSNITIYYHTIVIPTININHLPYHTSIGHEHEGDLLPLQPPQRLRRAGHGAGAARHHAVDVQHHGRATEAAGNQMVGGNYGGWKKSESPVKIYGLSHDL